MTAPLTLAPDQSRRECRCPTWVERCAHWNGLVLIQHHIATVASVEYICVNREWRSEPGQELTSDAHGGIVLQSLGLPFSSIPMRDWSVFEARLLSGDLERYFK